eukprot:4430870-Pleurochrysis_carterae.AAC.1
MLLRDLLARRAAVVKVVALPSARTIAETVNVDLATHLLRKGDGRHARAQRLLIPYAAEKPARSLSKQERVDQVARRLG